MYEKNTWEFINTFAPWLSAVGTILAVIVAIYLSRRERKIKLSVSAGHRLMFYPGLKGKQPEYIVITVINKGFRVAKLTNLCWKIGVFRKQFAIQTVIRDKYSSTMPIQLNDGGEAKYFIQINDENNWLNKFSKDFVKYYTWYRIKSLKIQAHTSIGKTFESKIEKNLRIKIKEILKTKI